MMSLEPNYQLVQEAKKCKYSLIPTSLTVEDVLQVWHQVCHFVTRQLLQNKAVNITGLGLFSLLYRKIELGTDRRIFVQRPVFVLSEKFAKTHALTYTKYQSPGEIPVVQLNLAAIAMEMGLDRDVVDQCIREFIGAFSRSVNIGNQANLGFKEIGQLVVKEGKAKMKFFKEFLRTVDGSNSSFSTPHLLKRLNTMDSFISRGSVMSSASLLRPNTFMLPSATNRNVWTSGAESDFPERPPSVVSNHGGNLTLSPLDTLDEVEKPVSKCRSTPQTPPCSERTWATDVLAYDGGMEMESVAKNINKIAKTDLKPSLVLETDGVEVLKEKENEKGVHLFKEKAPSPAANNLIKDSDDKPSSLPDLTSECHHNGGQELCYVCHQRQRRNIPISYAAEKQSAEVDLEKTLTQYQIHKDNQYYEQEQRYNLRDKEISKEVADCNLELAEKVRQNRKPDNKYHESYLFSRRPPVPLPKVFLTQEQYGNFLDGQVKLKTDREQKVMRETKMHEKDEQKHLKEDILKSKQRDIDEKVTGIKSYQAALNAQLQNKPYRYPSAVSDSDGPIFGKFDVNPAKVKDMRKRYKEIMNHQMKTVDEKIGAKEKEKHQAIQFEIDVMAKAKTEVREDNYKKYQLRKNIRNDLEKTWSSQHQMKKSRVADELRHRKKAGLLILDQCDKYKRCEQCQKCCENSGSSNLWKETRYLAGARLMI